MSARKRKKKQRFLVNLFFIFLALLGGFLLAIGFDKDNTEQKFVTKAESKARIRKKFIDKLAPYAVQLHQKFGIRPSIIIAQAALESNYGQSLLAYKHNNLFGIKEFGEGTSVNLKTKEYVNGHWTEIEGNFKVYADFNASMDDHASLLVNGVDWNRQLYWGVLQAPTYEAAAIELQKAGYATDPDYAQKIINVIKENNLAKYDAKNIK